MKTTYLIWQDAACNGVNPDWQEITGPEFYALPKQGRWFIKLASTEPDGSDGAIVMESTEAEYIAWKREKNHEDYLWRTAEGISVESYHAFDDGNSSFEDKLLSLYGLDMESDFLRRQEPELLQEALSHLNAEERQVIEYLYLSDEPGTERGYEALFGTPKSTVHRRHESGLRKLKEKF